MTRTLSLLAAALAFCACSREKASPSASEALAAAPSGEASYVTTPSLLRRQPVEAQKVAGPSGKEIANYLSTLQRGEKVTVVESKDDWARVRASDETEGWLKRAALLSAIGVSEATLLAQADAFDRPDLLAVNAKRKLEPGTLVLVVKSKELFSEVNLGSGASAWVLTERLSTAPREVMVAKLIDKARWLKRGGKVEDAREVLALARKQFADVALVDVLAKDLGEPVAEAAGGADGGLPGPDAPFAAPPAPASN